jgi:hypothetical protein
MQASRTIDALNITLFLGLSTLRLFILGVFNQGLQLLFLREHFEEVEQERHKVVTTTRILEL